MVLGRIVKPWTHIAEVNPRDIFLKSHKHSAISYWCVEMYAGYTTTRTTRPVTKPLIRMHDWTGPQLILQ